MSENPDKDVGEAPDAGRLLRENTELHAREKRQSAELAAAYANLETFAYSVSHDLRAPLRSMDGFAEILESDFGDRLGEEGLRVVGIIRAASQKMDELIVALLEFSRAGKGPLQPDRTDMSQLAGSAAREVRSLYELPTPLIEIFDLPALDVDPMLMRQVWCNLLSNALKFSAKRAQPKIRVSGRIAGKEAVFQVEDNGAGFDMRYADKLFGVFQRLHGSDEYPGIGIGLAIVHRIISRHGGRIWAKASPDGGACFQFALPHDHAS